jgi:hypothetical protein
MASRLIADRAGLFTCELEVSAAVLRSALEHERADELLRCAMITALAALAQEGPWPERALDALNRLMVDMREHALRGERC